MLHPHILAHDLGTTGNKITLFDAESGAVVASVFEAYGTAYPHPNWAEQDPTDWRRALHLGTRRLLAQAAALPTPVAPGDIAVVSFSGTMNGALPVDADGVPLRSAILWADQRATAEAGLLADRCGEAQVYRTTGTRITPSCSAAKFLWIQHHQPEIYDRTHLFLQVKDYAAFLLTGIFASDYSDASNTNLFDLEARSWAVDMAEATGLNSAKLPPLFPSTAVIGRVTAEAAALTGLLAGTPVVIGGGDGACATVGAGAILPATPTSTLARQPGWPSPRGGRSLTQRCAHSTWRTWTRSLSWRWARCRRAAARSIGWSTSCAAKGKRSYTRR